MVVENLNLRRKTGHSGRGQPRPQNRDRINV